MAICNRHPGKNIVDSRCILYVRIVQEIDQIEGKNQVNKKLRFLRESKGFSQKELSLIAEIDPSTYNRYEKGLKPGPTNAKRIAIALGTTADRLF